MTTTSYLEQRENLGKPEPLPISQLKISGSTSIRLIALRTGSRIDYAALLLRDGIVEKIVEVQDLSPKVSDGYRQSGIAICESSKIEIGRKIEF